MSKITQEILKHYLHYNGYSGIFTRIRKKPRGRGVIGEEVGTIQGSKGNDYLYTCVDGKSYRLHRLAWLYTYGKFPESQIDHINGNRMDNRICNLRNVTTTGNNRNKSLSKRNKTGVIGVRKIEGAKRKKWKSDIGSRNKLVTLYRGDDFFEAVCIRKSAEIKYGYDENHGGR